MANPKQDDAALLGHLKNLIYESEIDSRIVTEPKSIVELVSDKLQSMEANAGRHDFLKSGFDGLDKITGGLFFGELIVIGGRPGMGKSALLVNLASYLSLTVPVLYFTFDLTEEMLTNRFMASLTGVSNEHIVRNNLKPKEQELLERRIGVVKDRQLFITHSGNGSVSAFKAQCQKQIDEKGVKVIIVDYLQMMSSRHHGRNSRELEISYITRELKNIAKDNKVLVIAASQLSRNVEQRGGDKRPQLSDLRESGAIEQGADKVIFIYRPEYYGLTEDMNGFSTAGVADLILSKNRNGPTGDTRLIYRQEFTRFEDYDEKVSSFSFDEARMAELLNPSKPDDDAPF